MMTGAGLGTELPEEPFGRNFLVPRAEDADNGLIDALLAREGTVDAVAAYENILDAADADAIRRRLLDGTIDCVTFTSSSTVKNFASALGAALPASVLVACIGPSTAKTAEEVLGRAPDILAAEPTMGGFVTALERYYAGQN